MEKQATGTEKTFEERLMALENIGKETIINQTNHSYFNLNGDPSQVGTDMVLYVNADNYTPADKTYMTTGEIAPVEGTPMDFRNPHAIAETICDTTFQQIKNASAN